MTQWWENGLVALYKWESDACFSYYKDKKSQCLQPPSFSRGMVSLLTKTKTPGESFQAVEYRRLIYLAFVSVNFSVFPSLLSFFKKTINTFSFPQ